MTGTSRILRIYVGLVGILLVFPLLIVLAVSFDPGSYIAFLPRASAEILCRNVVERYDHARDQNSLIVGLVSSLLGTLLAVPAAVAITRGGAFRNACFIPCSCHPSLSHGLFMDCAIVFLERHRPAIVALDHHPRTHGHRHPLHLADHARRLARHAAELCASRARGRATPWNAFRHVVLPYIQPGVVAGASFAFIVSFTNIPVSLFLTTADNITLLSPSSII